MDGGQVAPGSQRTAQRRVLEGAVQLLPRVRLQLQLPHVVAQHLVVPHATEHHDRPPLHPPPPLLVVVLVSVPQAGRVAPASWHAGRPLGLHLMPAQRGASP